MKRRLILLWFDFVIFLSNIEMRFKYWRNRIYFNHVNEDWIPHNTFYCYEGCRIYGEYCPYMDYPVIFKILTGRWGKYCHYVKGGLDDALLYDDCKICGVNEFEGEEDE